MSAGSSLFQALPPARAEVVRRQESGLILLNLAVMASLALMHVLFAGALGRPPRMFYLVILGRFLMQTVELIWLQGIEGGWSGRLLPFYTHVSIWLHIGFAFLLSRLGGFEDSHYVALMVVPVIAAGFRYHLRGIAVVVGAAASLTFLEVYLYFLHRPQVRINEYFEASNVVLIYVVVAVVVAFLSRELHAEQRQLAHNLEELERTRDRLVQEEKLAVVGRLSSSIAHEIRNPVSLILSSVALAREKGPGALADDEVCDIVTREARRLEKLTSDFLLYARQRPPERRTTSVEVTLDYIASLVRARLAEVGLGLAVSCPADLEFDLDPFQIHQALLNLVSNAIDAAPAKAEILLGAKEDGGGITFFVENPGAAIPADAAGSVFEPFFTTKPAGTGLGLAIARSIARSHGGELRLAGNEAGRVRFELSLPGPVRRRTTEEAPRHGAHSGR